MPTNHLYLGDVIICPRDKASFPDITVEQGIRIFLTGGMALSSRVRARHGATIASADFRVVSASRDPVARAAGLPRDSTGIP